MLKLFQVCFYTGALYTIISFVLGQLLDFAGVGGDVDADMDMDLDIDVDADTAIDVDGNLPGTVISPLKPITIASFVTVFGGVGMIFLRYGHGILIATAAAAITAFTISFLLYRFLVVPLYRAQNTSAVSQKDLIGSMAKAALHMEGSKFGKINYTVEGNTYSAPAKSIDGAAIAKGVPVVIINIQKNIFYVKEIKGGNM